MENDNIKRDENLQEESLAEETVATEATEATETEVEETSLEEAAEAVTEEAVEVDEEIAEAEADCDETVIELTEEDLAKMEELRKKERNRNWLIAAVVAAVIAVVAFFVCYTEGVGSKNVVSGTVFSTNTEETGFWSKLKGDNIRYENPIVTVFEKMTGKNKEAVMKISGIAVDEDVLSSVVNSSGIDYVHSLIQIGELTDLSTFDWNKVDENTGLSYLELSKSIAVETLVPYYATIAAGEKNGVEFTKEDEKNITDWIAEQKEIYGEDFEKVLKASGYEEENTLYEIRKIQLYTQKICADIESNPTKYITKSVKNKLDDGKITVKHILIGFEQGDDGSVSDEAKANAKKTAEEVLAKVKAGDDFDALVEEYNTDPGATDSGYTFAQDGSMVKEFEDASFALEIGETSELVETTYGYHIIKRIERNVTPDDYISVLIKTAPVNIKKGAYNDMKITLDLNDYFGSSTETETQTEE